MEFKFQHLVAFLSLAVVVCHATSPSEDYWKSVLPNSPMPKSLKDLLNPIEWVDEKSTTVRVNKGGVNANTGRRNSGPGSVGSNTSKPSGKGGVTVARSQSPSNLHKHAASNLYKHAASNLYKNAASNLYKHSGSEFQKQGALFFLEKDLHPGQKMNLYFSKTPNQANFLPRKVADSIPFSSKKLPEILSQFSVKPRSEEAEIMKETIDNCEETGIKGEDKFCATSLESMIDFSTSKLGRNVEAISTNAEQKTHINSIPKEYGFVAVKQFPSKKAVICHRMEYAYAVFYCHKTDSTAAYQVSMVAADGSKAEAVAVCHRDTAEWNPKHLAFQVLKVKPGTVPICHFLLEDHIAWIPKSL